jgi:peptidoglycan/xylan/chitin deacetylase (PgdA/CDA1 family)
MSTRIKWLILIIFIAAIFTPQLLFVYHNYHKQQGITEQLMQSGACPITSLELQTVKRQELVKIPAPSGKQVSIPILMYHEIGDGPDCLWVSAPDFSNQMKYLHDNGYQTITLSQAVELLRGHYDTSKKVVLTFDDGYYTFYSNAWPVLQEYEQSASVFIISDLVGKPGYMTWAEIKDLSAAGLEVGGHTMTHPLLPTLSPEKSNEEIVGAKQAIETQLGENTSSFCYPTGKYDARAVEQVQTAGYTAAVTMVQRQASSSDDMLLLPRWGVYKGDPLERFIGLIK